MLPWRLEIDPPQFPSVTMYSNESGNASVSASVAANARCGIALTRWLACQVPNVFVCYRHRKPKYSYLVWMCLKVHTHLTKGNSCEILTTNLYPFAAMSLSLSGNVNVSLSDNARLVWMWIDLQKVRGSDWAGHQGHPAHQGHRGQSIPRIKTSKRIPQPMLHIQYTYSLNHCSVLWTRAIAFTSSRNFNKFWLVFYI